MAEQLQLDEQFTISDLETLKIISDPLRIRIMRTLRWPKTVKKIADELEMPATKLYYHVNQMEKHGLIRVAATNIVSGIIEKQYQVVARRYQVDETLLSDKESFTNEALESLIIAILDDTKEELRKSIRAGMVEATDTTPEKGWFLKGRLRLEPDQVAEFTRQLQALFEQYEPLSEANDNKPEVQIYGLTVAVYPASESRAESGM
jgi:DNA-binding transcriptional ArsR family regulator